MAEDRENSSEHFTLGDINRQELQKKTLYELKEILKQSGQKVSGKKSDLVERICGVLASSTCDTPSTSKTAEAQFLELSAPHKSKDNDLSYDTLIRDVKGNNLWQKDLRNLPAFDFVRLYDYLVIQTNKYDHIALKTSGYKKLKAFQFFAEGHIKDLELAEVGGLVYIKGEVLASMN